MNERTLATRLIATALVLAVAAIAQTGCRIAAPEDSTAGRCPDTAAPVSSTALPDPRRSAPERLRAAVEDAADEEFLRFQTQFNWRALLDELTPSLADAYARRWLHLATLPRAWFVERGLWDPAIINPDQGPIAELKGDPVKIIGAAWRLPIARALASGRIASDARLAACRIVSGGGIPVAEALQDRAGSLSVDQQRELMADSLLAPAREPAVAVPPSDVVSARSWLQEDPQRPLRRLPMPVRREIVAEIAGSTDRAHWALGDASSLLAEYAADLATSKAAIDFLRGVRWPVDLRHFPGPLARALLDKVGHVPLSPAERARLSGDGAWAVEAVRSAREDGDLGALSELTRWRVRDAAPRLREIASSPGRYYLADGASIALAALGDRRALVWLHGMFRSGPPERVWQFMHEPMPFAATPEIIGLLLDAVSDGRTEAQEVSDVLRQWFGTQVDMTGGDGPYYRAALIAAWRAWWERNAAKWCWDPWSARCWPEEVWAWSRRPGDKGN